MRFKAKNAVYFLSQLEKFWKKHYCVHKSVSKKMNFKFFKVKIARICPEKTLIPNFFQFCRNALKTKASLEVHFRKEDGFRRLFVTSSHIEKKTNFSRIVQLISLHKRTQVATELFFFYVELWAENTNPQHRHTLFAISKINFSEKLYSRQKILHKSFETYGQDRIWPFSVCCFKSSSCWDIYCDIYRP